MSLTDFDVTNIAILANMIKNICTKFDYGNSKTAEKIYEIDSCARKILTIVEKNDKK